MSGHVLTLNAGSSSIKFALFDLAGASSGTAWRPEWSGIADRLGRDAVGTLRIRDRAGAVRLDAELGSGASHAHALEALLRWRAGEGRAAPLSAVGHRVVHGGTRFVEPMRLDADVIAGIEALAPLAPLHQPHNVAGIRAAMAAFADVPHVACFDTAFHATQSAVHQRFAIPRRWHDAGIRRYGFHGLSYESIVGSLDALDPALPRARIVVAHLGNGASLCAVANGRSLTTTMSFSPLDGLTMGTRCGHIDAAVVLHLLQAEGLSAEAIAELLYRQSGLLGLSGLSSDVRELEAANTAEAAAALEHFVERVVQGIGEMAAALRGVDALVFTGGIGENAVALRARMLEGCAWLGADLDAAANASGGPRLTTASSRVAAYVLRTDEEAVIARHTAAKAGLIGARPGSVMPPRAADAPVANAPAPTRVAPH